DEVEARERAEFARQPAARAEHAELVGSIGEGEAHDLCDPQRNQVMLVKERDAPQEQRVEYQTARCIGRASDEEPDRPAEGGAGGHCSSISAMRMFCCSTSRGRNGERSSSAGEVILPSGCALAPSLGAKATFSSTKNSQKAGPSAFSVSAIASASSACDAALR